MTTLSDKERQAMRVMASMMVPSMGILSKRVTSMGSRVPRLTVTSIRTALSTRANVETAKFKVDSMLGNPDGDVVRGSVMSLAKLALYGVDEVHLLMPGGGDDWAMLYLTRVPVPKVEWTEEDKQFFSTQGKAPHKTLVRVGVIA